MSDKLVELARRRQWVYPMSIKGKWTTLRNWTFVGLHAVLFVLPWIKIGGLPAIRVDLQARQTYVFGAVMTASETTLLLLILLFLAFCLFFFTALLGRVWCGYACPQTVFLESWIRPLEQWIEGGHVRRRRRNEAGMSFDLVWRKVVKWGAFAAVSILISMAMMSYFAGARELWTGNAGTVEYSLVAILSFLWFWDFTWFREQFCNYLCPYARFQSALTDDDSLLITYHEDRGEPRGGKEARYDGRCIECQKCVAVCPQGIDIRDGFQLECIQCARCIDACEDVMSRLGHKTLVSYSSFTELKGKRRRWLRPRTVAYAALLTGIILAGATRLAVRIPFEVTVNRAPGTLFTVDGDGFVRNTYLVKITNNDPRKDVTSFEVEVEGLENAEIISRSVDLGPTETSTVPLVVRIPASEQRERTVPIRVRVASDAGELIVPTTFKTGAGVG